MKRLFIIALVVLSTEVGSSQAVVTGHVLHDWWSATQKEGSSSSTSDAMDAGHYQGFVD